MKIKSIGKNQTELHIKSDSKHYDYYGNVIAIYQNNMVIFFSYETPVAAEVDGTFYRTIKKHSVTTSRHVNSWLEGRPAEKKDQSFFDQLIA